MLKQFYFFNILNIHVLRIPLLTRVNKDAKDAFPSKLLTKYKFEEKRVQADAISGQINLDNFDT